MLSFRGQTDIKRYFFEDFIQSVPKIYYYYLNHKIVEVVRDL